MDDPVVPMCRNCGVPLPPGRRYCGHCGLTTAWAGCWEAVGALIVVASLVVVGLPVAFLGRCFAEDPQTRSAAVAVVAVYLLVFALVVRSLWRAWRGSRARGPGGGRWVQFRSGKP